MGWHDVTAVVSSGLDQLSSVHPDVAEVDVLVEARSDVVDEHVAEAGVQLGALEDDHAVFGGQLRVVGVEVELSVLGEHDAVNTEPTLAEHVDPFEVLFDGGAGIVGGHGMAMQVEVGQKFGLRAPKYGGAANE